MSAYVLQPEEFRALATMLVVRQHSSDYKHWFRQRVDPTPAETFEDLMGKYKEFTPRELVEEWYALNLYAYDQRYGTGTAAAEEEPPTLPASCWHADIRAAQVSDGALYGLLSCLHYQCSEGDADTKPEFARLESWLHGIADKLARVHKDYRWGWKPEESTHPMAGRGNWAPA